MRGDPTGAPGVSYGGAEAAAAQQAGSHPFTFRGREERICGGEVKAVDALGESLCGGVGEHGDTALTVPGLGSTELQVAPDLDDGGPDVDGALFEVDVADGQGRGFADAQSSVGQQRDEFSPVGLRAGIAASIVEPARRGRRPLRDRISQGCRWRGLPGRRGTLRRRRGTR